MLIKVLKTTKGAKNKNGIECQEYLANQTYEMFDELAEVFISNGWGVKAIDNLEEDKIEIQEEKALDILENKAIDNLEEDKIEIQEEKALDILENKAIDNLENKSIKTKKGK